MFSLYALDALDRWAAPTGGVAHGGLQAITAGVNGEPDRQPAEKIADYAVGFWYRLPKRPLQIQNRPSWQAETTTYGANSEQ